MNQNITQTYDYLKYRIKATTASYYMIVTIFGYMATLNLLGFLVEAHAETWWLWTIGGAATLILGLSAWRWVINRQPMKSLGWILKLTNKQLLEMGTTLSNVKGYFMLTAFTKMRSLFALAGFGSIILGTTFSHEDFNSTSASFYFIVGGASAALYSLVISGITAVISNRVKIRMVATEDMVDTKTDETTTVEEAVSSGEEKETVDENTVVKKKNHYRTWDDKPKYGEDAP